MNAMHQSNAVTTLFRLTSMVCLLASAYAQAYEYPFQDPALPAAQRIDNILSLMTVEEKIAALSTDSSVKRLGIPSFGSSEGIHGVVKRGNAEKGLAAIPTTQFPQPPGMGETWNPSLVRAAGEIQGTEGRYITQKTK
jgi:beta-glucosidase